MIGHISAQEKSNSCHIHVFLKNQLNSYLNLSHIKNLSLRVAKHRKKFYRLLILLIKFANFLEEREAAVMNFVYFKLATA